VPAGVIDRPKGYFPVPALSTLEGDTLTLIREAMDAPGRGPAGCSALTTSSGCSPRPTTT